MANKDLIVNNPDMSLDQKLMALLACIAQEKQAEIDRLLAASNLSLLQLNLLHTLAKSASGQLTVNQLKSAMVGDNPNVSRTLNKMVEQGLVTKTRSEEDQRTVHIAITDDGHRLHNEGDRSLMGVGSGLSQKDQRALFELLLKL